MPPAVAAGRTVADAALVLACAGMLTEMARQDVTDAVMTTVTTTALIRALVCIRVRSGP
jgi:hypothetical protein